MTTMFRRDGTPVEVPNEQVAAARASGELFFEHGARVNVISPEGERQTIDQAELLPAMGAGYQLETDQALEEGALEKKYGSFGAPLRAAAGAGVRGLTVGLSDLALPDEALQEQERLERAYPKTAMGGEIAGFTVPLLLSGGTGAVAKGASATLPSLISRGAGAVGRRIVGEGLAAKVARYGVEGAIEGSAYGAGQGLHEAELTGGDPDHYAERILAGAAHGATFGGLTGAGVGLVGAGVRRAGEKLLAGIDPAKLSDELAVRAIDPSKRAARELQNTGRTLEVGQDLKTLGIVRPGASTEQMLEAATAANKKAGDAIGKLFAKLDEAGARVEAKGLTDATMKVMSRFNESLSRGDQVVARRIGAEVRPMLEAATGESGLTFSKLHEVRRGLDQQINFAKRASDPIQTGLVKLRGELENVIETQAEKAFADRGLGSFLAEYQPAKRAFGSSRWAEKQLSDNLARGQANHFLGLLDRVSGTAGIVTGLATGSFGLGAIASGAAALGSKILREKGAGVLSIALDRAAKTDSKILSSVRRFARHARHGEEVGVGAVKDVLRAEDFKHRTDKTLKRRGTETRQQAYQRTVKEISEFNHEDVMKRMGNLASEMPSTAAALVGKLSAQHDYLAANLPTGVVAAQDPLQPNRQPMATPTEIARFARIKRVVDRPLSILDDMETGVVSPESVRALRDVWPGLYGQIRTTLFQELSKRTTRMPYAKRAVIGAMFDIQANPVQAPERMQQVQAIFQKQNTRPEPPPQGGPVQSSKYIKQFQTDIQSLEAGDFAI